MQLLKSLSHLLYHIAVVVLSAAVALSLPYTAKFAAGKFLRYWALIENEKMFLVSIEIATAVLLILFFNFIMKNMKNKRLSRMAKEAGLFAMGRGSGLIDRTRLRKMKEKNGLARNVMVIGSTGFTTFTDPSGDLHHVIQKCREAKIMLLDPSGEGAGTRARSISCPDITVESFRDQIAQSILFLKGLREVQKDIRLKLYREVPLVKLAILGDYAFLRHYHPGVDVQQLPEYVFRHERSPGCLYNPFYQYFLDRWHDPHVPEYELETDELIYRDKAGNEVRREKAAFLALPQAS
ncbi:conserved hypothetical protein [Candidatus Sulfobium mesophilum]|uniref:Uncharacterized protein n=1 Tax=Candidatus Sulfobium mesophilum TaxID=2016548 RepID=A0A2U3QGB7_9BACT|nr:conserved hypothetical protein [Candidatus Sulfobium mesophilum]